MHCMWAALVLLLLYMLTVFLGSRLLDIVLWCTAEQGGQLVDPFLLSVRQLKQLLETRGVSHTGYIEKQELAQLVKDSADVTAAEVIELSAREQEKLPSPSASFEFTGSAHFYEQVEDTKDSVWLVQVIPAGRESQQVPLLDDYTWKYVDSQVAPFAVRTGIFNCNYGRRLCRSKGWFEPLLLLALPRGEKPKDRVVLRTSQLTRPQAIIEWLREQLSIRVHKISDEEELERDWLPDSSSSKSESSVSSNDVKVLLFTHLIHPPLFLAALSIKFTGRIKFGMFTVRKEESESLKKKVGRTPSYVVITPEGVTVYGQRKGEHFNFRSMDTFLRTVQPEINDIFICTLLFVNMIVLLQIFQVTVDLWWKRIVSTLWIIVSHNLFLFWVWIFVFGIRRWPLFTVMTDQLLIFVRYFWMSQLGTLVRSDCQIVLNYPMCFIISFSIFGFCGKRFISVKPPSSQTQQGVSDQRAWWEVLPLDCLFRPISASSTLAHTSSATHSHPYVPVPVPGPLDVQLEEGIEMLIERLAVPNFWLQSISHNSDYIKDLPVWKIPSPFEEADEEALLRMMDSDTDRNKLLAYGEDCAVCLESYQFGDTLCGLPCGHCYHQKCLMLWLQTDNHHCPVCRWPAYKSHPHQHKYHTQ